jgi:hypothetical protein
MAEQSTSVVSMYPTSGLSLKPQLVWMSGRAFDTGQPLMCRVGIQGVVRPPVLVVGNTIACLLPAAIDLQFRAVDLIDAQIDNAPRDIDVPVSIVALNGKELTSPITFRYLGQCPRGSFCPENAMILPCPIGAMCPVEGMLRFLLCPPGTFQSRAGSFSCIVCPSGTFCPDYGMASPTLCPPGWLCNIEEQSLPNELCPPGSFCPPSSVNTSTALLDLLVFNSWLSKHAKDGVPVVLPGGSTIVVQPNGDIVNNPPRNTPLTPSGQLKCPFNTFCYYGVGTNITSFEAYHPDLLRPKFCNMGVVCTVGSSRSEASPNSTVPAGFWAP